MGSNNKDVTYKCKYCEKEFKSVSQLGGHVRGCLKNPNRICNNPIKATMAFKELHSLKIYKFVCEKCNIEFEKSMSSQRYLNLKNHPRFCSRSCANSHIVTEEHKQKVSKKLKDIAFKYPEKLFKYKKYTCKNCGKEFDMSFKRNTKSRTYCSSECRETWLNINVRPKQGGYRKGSGRGKGGWYKDIYCDSSWELAFVIYHMDNNIDIKRCKSPRKYIYNGKELSYYPDFIVNGKTYEIKGYETEQSKAKHSQNRDVILLMKKDMEFYINYCKTKYGKDFINKYN